MKTFKIIGILLLVFFILVPFGVSAQTLSPSDWWAWIYVPQTDEIHLINESGQQAVISRPTMPGELTVAQANPQIAVSHNGRHIMLSARLSNGNVGLGFYSLEARRFIQIHEAQPGEEVVLGGSKPFAGTSNVFALNGDRVAVGFATPGLNAWRVIVFEVESGNWLYQIDQAQVNSLGIIPPSTRVYPRVMLYDPEGNVHTQIVPFGTPVTERNPAFAWNPDLGNVTSSPYELARADINPTNGLSVFASTDSETPQLPPDLSGSYNAISTGTDKVNETLLSDGTQYHRNAQWAADGELVLFQTKAVNNTNFQWNAFRLTEQTLLSLDADIRQVYALPDGFLSVNNVGAVAFHSLTDPGTGTQLWQLPGITEVYIVWTIPSYSQFTLNEIPAEPDAMVTTNRLNVRQNPGEGARILTVVGRDNPLRVVGRLPDNSWLQVITPDGITGWVTRNFIQVNVDLSTVVVINAPIIYPPTPTPGLPIIEYFLVDDSYIRPGTCATITWSVTGAASVILNHNQQGQTWREPVEARGTRLVCPTSFIFYSLTAESLTGRISSQVIQIYVGEGY